MRRCLKSCGDESKSRWGSPHLHIQEIRCGSNSVPPPPKSWDHLTLHVKPEDDLHMEQEEQRRAQAMNSQAASWLQKAKCFLFPQGKLRVAPPKWMKLRTTAMKCQVARGIVACTLPLDASIGFLEANSADQFTSVMNLAFFGDEILASYIPGIIS